MDAALWSVRGSPCECCRRELHYCEEEGHCGEDPPDAACRAVFLIRLGRGGGHQSGFSVPKPTASSVTCKVGARVTLGPARGVLGNGAAPCLLRPWMRRTRL